MNRRAFLLAYATALAALATPWPPPKTASEWVLVGTSDTVPDFKALDSAWGRDAWTVRCDFHSPFRIYLKESKAALLRPLPEGRSRPAVWPKQRHSGCTK
jgi:hypothetical protein